MKEIELNVVGMKCHGCENRVKNILMDIKEIKKVEANFETGKVNIVLKKDFNEEIQNKINEKFEKLEDFKIS